MLARRQGLLTKTIKCSECQPIATGYFYPCASSIELCHLPLPIALQVPTLYSVPCTEIQTTGASAQPAYGGDECVRRAVRRVGSLSARRGASGQLGMDAWRMRSVSQARDDANIHGMWWVDRFASPLSLAFGDRRGARGPGGGHAARASPHACRARTPCAAHAVEREPLPLPRSPLHPISAQKHKHTRHGGTGPHPPI
jgi:hypothetical protein